MKKLFESEQWFTIQQVAHALEAHRIPYLVKNEFANGAVGELAPQDAIPQIWLLDDDWFARANALVEELMKVATDGNAWYCSTCGEHNDASFEVCWKCGSVCPSIAR